MMKVKNRHLPNNDGPQGQDPLFLASIHLQSQPYHRTNYFWTERDAESWIDSVKRDLESDPHRTVSGSEIHLFKHERMIVPEGMENASAVTKETEKEEESS